MLFKTRGVIKVDTFKCQMKPGGGETGSLGYGAYDGVSSHLPRSRSCTRSVEAEGLLRVLPVDVSTLKA